MLLAGGQELERGGGQVPFLFFSIEALRFQNTWKDFAPFPLTGYRPQGSVLIHVPGKSPEQAIFPTWASAHVSKNTGETGSPSRGDLGHTSMVFTHSPRYCQNNELLMTNVN